jgi:8-oxo-dGTP pyrophosphatase MutT (NUDIX family)
MTAFKLSTTARSALTEIIETAYRNVPQDFLPVYLNDEVIGHVAPHVLQSVNNLLHRDDNELSFIQATPQKIIFNQAIPYDLSIELRILAQHLRDTKIITGWRNEEFSFLDEYGHERFRVERTFFRALGLHSRAVHINGYIANEKIWLARRSHSKHIDPNLLDNVTAGGVSANETLLSCAIRELNEEAGIHSDEANRLNPVGLITVRRDIGGSSMHHETLYTFDLELSESFVPTNQDDEVSEFILVSYEEALHLILGLKMTVDAAIVTGDFLLRHC